MPIEFTISRATRRRYFTPAEANELLPQVREELEVAQLLVERSRGVAARPPAPEGTVGKDPMAEFRQLQEQARIIIEGIAERGIEVKGLEPGLLDFPALRHGLEVLLCWRQGERRIEHWHPIPTGIAGRQPVEGTPDDAWEWCN